MAFVIYKREQGKYTRLGTGFALVILIGLGCYQLYRLLEGADVNLWVMTMVPAGLFAVLGGLSFWLVNRQTIADFMISAEGEMKKVSWSSRKEIAVSTFVVIAVVVIIAVLLGLTDLIFQLFFTWLWT
jgi:preprotein translocase SecE subunit